MILSLNETGQDHFSLSYGVCRRTESRERLVLTEASKGATVKRTDCFPVTSERLHLRALAMDDFGSTLNLYQQSKTGDWFPGWDMDEIRAQQFLAWQIGKYNTWDILNAKGSLAIVRKDTGDFIGHCGIGKHEGLPETEMFVGLEKQHRNMGYASEAVTALTNWADPTFGIPFLCATILMDNLPSQKGLEKCGCAFITTRRIDCQARSRVFKVYRMQSLAQESQQ